MIKNLHIQNSQSHKNTYMEFHKGLNVIVGDTDSGKSVIMRSLDKVIYNGISSKGLISHWGGPLSISVTVEDNKITLKHDKKDTYTLNKTKFSAIGSKVPEEISTALNMEDVNFQHQSEYWFLLNETSGYVASYLNQIANISQIDSVTRSIKSDLNKTKRNIEHDKETLTEKETQLSEYSYLPNFKAAIDEVRNLIKKIEDYQFKIGIIKSNLNKLDSFETLLTENKKLLILKPLINETLHIKETIEKTKARQKRLVKLYDSYISIEDEVKDIYQLVELKPIIETTIKLKNKQSNLKLKLDALKLNMSKLSSFDEKIKIAQSNKLTQMNIYESELHKLDKCFFCGSKITKD